MKKLAWIVVAALLLVIGLVLLSRRTHVDAPVSPPNTTSSNPRNEATLASPASSSLDARREPAAATSTIAPEAQPLTDPALVCTVLGRVLDEDDRPLRDVRVRVQAHKRWSTALVLTPFADDPRFVGFETRTDVDGRFRVVAARPPDAEVTLHLEPEFHHDALVRWLGGSQADALPALHPGDNDLGSFHLAGTGAVTGTVRDVRGSPIAGAKLYTGSGIGNSTGDSTTSDESGRFRVAHVPPGTWGVSARADGFLASYVEPFEVRRGETTTGPDIVLKDAPALKGFVRDDKGRPLNDVRVTGWPQTNGSGSSANTRSKLDGSFTLWLTEIASFSLEATLEGYAPAGTGHVGVAYAPGTEGIEIVLVEDPKTTFVVVDAATRAPVTTFDLVVDRDMGTPPTDGTTRTTMWAPAPKSHPDGTITLGARPKLDAYRAWSPGYRMGNGVVEHESPTSTRQIVALARGTILRGRVTQAGSPSVNARVRIEPGDNVRVSLRGKVPIESFVARAGEFQELVTDAHGTFEATGFSAGVHRIRAFGANGSTASRVTTIRAEPVVDVGDVELQEPATIEGRIVMPTGVDVGGRTVRIGHRFDALWTTTTSSGVFRFVGLPAGRTVVTLDAVKGAIPQLDPVVVELAAGETRSIVFDATQAMKCTVALRVLTRGTPTKGCTTILRREDGRSVRGWNTVTDDDGRARGTVDEDGLVTIEVSLPSGLPLARDPVRLLLDPVRPAERVIEADVGHLVIDWPAGETLVTGSGIELTFADADADAPMSRGGILLPVTPAESVARSVDVGPIGIGEYRMFAALTVGRNADGSPIHASYEKRIHVSQDAVTRVRFDANDRRK